MIMWTMRDLLVGSVSAMVAVFVTLALVREDTVGSPPFTNGCDKERCQRHDRNGRRCGRETWVSNTDVPREEFPEPCVDLA